MKLKLTKSTKFIRPMLKSIVTLLKEMLGRNWSKVLQAVYSMPLCQLPSLSNNQILTCCPQCNSANTSNLCQWLLIPFTWTMISATSEEAIMSNCFNQRITIRAKLVPTAGKSLLCNGPSRFYITKLHKPTTYEQHIQIDAATVYFSYFKIKLFKLHLNIHMYVCV